MSPPAPLLDRVRLRLRSRRRLERALAVAEADRDGARAVALGWQREARAAQAHASHWRRNVGELVGVQSEGTTDGELHRRLQTGWSRQVTMGEAAVRLDEAIEKARRVLRGAGYDVTDETKIGEDVDRALVELIDQRDAARRELDDICDELRATGHPIGDRGLSYDVDAAIDRERSRAQDVVERLADALGWDEYRAGWPYSAPHLIREVAVRLGQPMPRRRVRPSDWAPGSRLARTLACTCRGDRGQGPSSIVDSQCPEHSPGYRFGGRPVRPLALPPGTAAPPSRYGLDALDRLVGDGLAGEWVCDACDRSVGVLPCPEHQPRAHAEALAEVPF